MIKINYLDRRQSHSHEKYFKTHADALIHLIKEAQVWGYKYEFERLTNVLAGLKRPYKSSYSTIITNVFNIEMLKASDSIAFPSEIVYIPEPLESADMYLNEVSKLISEVTK